MWSQPSSVVNDTRTRPFYQFKLMNCSPRADAFTPCEDLFDKLWLRIAVRIVAPFALIGNILVVAVLLFARRKLDRQRVLIINLAAADLCMGIYLSSLVIVDATSEGEFAQHALDWQFSPGCKMAGFMAIFSTELSFFILTLITLERFFTIRHAMESHNCLTKPRLGILLLVGWVFAVIMATLPLVGVNSYNKYVLALPFEFDSAVDQSYVAFMLIFNGVGFFTILLCYIKIYRAMMGSPAWKNSDSQVNWFISSMLTLLQKINGEAHVKRYLTSFFKK